MRAMVVSFATWNLWLDWKKIASTLARLFLDFEPGIHYPQLQMQSGCSGINQMRVYNVTKQGVDQDPSGVFIRKWVVELRKVQDEHIHKPGGMSRAAQVKVGVQIGEEVKGVLDFGKKDGRGEVDHYPSPIVDEMATARVAKDKVAAVRKLDSTKRLAREVYEKHGSRKGPSDYRKSMKREKRAGAAGGRQEEKKEEVQQNTIMSMFGTSTSKQTMTSDVKHDGNANWRCETCTYDNDKPHAPICEICGSSRGK